LTKNGIPSQEPVQFSSNNTNVVKVDNGELVAVGAGKAQVIVTLINYPTIYQTLDITVGEQTVFSAYIEGPATLRLDRETIYKFVGTE